MAYLFNTFLCPSISSKSVVKYMGICKFRFKFLARILPRWSCMSLVISFCVTNLSQTLWLKTTVIMYYLVASMDQGFMQGTGGWLVCLMISGAKLKNSEAGLKSPKAWLRLKIPRSSWFTHLVSNLVLANGFFFYVGLSIGLLGHPHNMVADFPHSDWSERPMSKQQCLWLPSLWIHTLNSIGHRIIPYSGWEVYTKA